MNRIDRYIEVELKKYTKDYRDRARQILVDYDEWSDPVLPEISEVKKYIEDNELNVKDHRRHIVYNRFYLYAFLQARYKDLSLSAMGRFFNQDHSSAIRGKKEHDKWTGLEDKEYSEVTAGLRKLFPI